MNGNQSTFLNSMTIKIRADHLFQEIDWITYQHSETYSIAQFIAPRVSRHSIDLPFFPRWSSFAWALVGRHPERCVKHIHTEYTQYVHLSCKSPSVNKYSITHVAGKLKLWAARNMFCKRETSHAYACVPAVCFSYVYIFGTTYTHVCDTYV